MNNTNTKKFINVTIRILAIFSIVVLLLGLVLSACLKIEKVSNVILPFYPRYNLAMDAIKIFEKDPLPIKKGDTIQTSGNSDKPVMATVLSIEHPSWQVIMDFIKSETAFRKSDRNNPNEEYFNTTEKSSENSNKTDGTVLGDINYDRVKTIFVIRVRDVFRAGDKPLTEPYRILVFDMTSKTARRVYDFISFEEFKLDLKKMLVGELELCSIICSIFAALCNIALYFIRRKYFKAN